MLQCKVCEREAENDYCELHEKAHRNILREYDVWKKASDVSWKQYLIEIAKNPCTGVWAKEVVESLISETK